MNQVKKGVGSFKGMTAGWLDDSDGFKIKRINGGMISLIKVVLKIVVILFVIFVLENYIRVFIDEGHELWVTSSHRSQCYCSETENKLWPN
jgi:hypothetical protein